MSDMTSTKSYVIAKRAVWEAYRQVKANRGSAGIDEETIAMFDQNLSKNLYKLWNRMSSGSYLPPPVKQVEIPKAKGGTRKLGIPTVSDRIAVSAEEGQRQSEPDIHQFFAGSECRCLEAYAEGGAGLAHPSADTGDISRSGEAMQSGDTRVVELLWSVLSDGDAQAVSIRRSKA